MSKKTHRADSLHNFKSSSKYWLNSGITAYVDHLILVKIILGMFNITN